MDIIDSLVQYFNSGATEKKRVGLEIEHFVMKNGSPLGYMSGVRDILTELSSDSELKFYENENIIGCDMGEYTLTLEPAAQLEVSILPMSDTREIYRVLQSFYEKAEPILKKYSASLETIPALSDSLLAETELIPKKRYEYMDRYFKTSGTMGKNMMRGSTSVQVSVDYENEADFVRKFRLAYIMSPIFAYLMSEDKDFRRVTIWDNTDRKRTYIPTELFSDSFGFESYAMDLLKVPAIFIPQNGDYIYTSDKTIGELCEQLTVTDELTEHFLSMVFPDVRLKKYIEIRIADSTLPEKAIEYAELVKTLFYTDASDVLLNKYKNVTTEDILKAKQTLITDCSVIKAESDRVMKIAEKYGFKRNLL